MRFARAGLSHKQQVFVLLKKLAGCQFDNLPPVDGGLKGKVKILNPRLRRKLGSLEEFLAFVVCPPSLLIFQKECQKLCVAEVLLLCFSEPPRKRLCRSGK